MSMKDMFRSNLQMKLLSLLLAATLWLFVTLEASDEMEIPLSVNFVNIPVGLAVQGEKSPQVAVAVEGSRVLLLRLKLKGVSVQLDLSGAKAGRSIYSGVEKYLKPIQGVKLLRASPSQVEVTLAPYP